MRWNKMKHALDEEKTVRRFAFLPTKLNNPRGEYVWLEWYNEDLVYTHSDYGSGYVWRITRRYL